MGSTSCSVRGCHNNWKKRRDFLNQECFEHRPLTRSQCCGAPYDLHPPPRDEEQLRFWLKALNLKNPPKRAYVCSFHFVDGKPTEQHPFPEKFLGYEVEVKKPRRVLQRGTNDIQPATSLHMEVEAEENKFKDVQTQWEDSSKSDHAYSVMQLKQTTCVRETQCCEMRRKTTAYFSSECNKEVNDQRRDSEVRQAVREVKEERRSTDNVTTEPTQGSSQGVSRVDLPQQETENNPGVTGPPAESESESEVGLLDALSRWAAEHRITHTAVNALLAVLGRYHPWLPKDAQSLLGTARSTNFKVCEKAEFFEDIVAEWKQSCYRSDIQSDYENGKTGINIKTYSSSEEEAPDCRTPPRKKRLPSAPTPPSPPTRWGNGESQIGANPHGNSFGDRAAAPSNAYPNPQPDRRVPSSSNQENTQQGWRSFNTTQCTPFERVLLEAVREMDIRLTHLTSMVATLVQDGRRPQPGHLEDFGDALPIPLQDMEALDRLEERLQNNEYKKKMISVLSQTEGHTLKKTVWRIAKKMFTTSLAKKLNWCGRGNKRGLRTSKCAEVIIGAAMKNPQFKSSEAEVEKNFQYFLRLAPGRK